MNLSQQRNSFNKIVDNQSFEASIKATSYKEQAV